MCMGNNIKHVLPLSKQFYNHPGLIAMSERRVLEVQGPVFPRFGADTYPRVCQR